MIHLLQLLLAPLRQSRLRRAEQEYQASPGRETLTAYAAALSGCGRNLEALNLLQQSRGNLPLDAKLQALLKKLRRNQAAALLAQAQAQHKKYSTVDTCIRVASLLKATGQLSKAQHLVTPFVHQQPHHAALRRVAGTIYLERHQSTQQAADLESAMAHLQASLQLEPNDTRTLLSMAMAQCAAGSYAEALLYLGSILERLPTDSRAQRLRNFCEKQLGASSGHTTSARASGGASSRRPAPGETQPTDVADSLFAHPEARAVFALAKDGTLVAAHTRPSTRFSFESPEDALKSLAAAARIDGVRIGIGPVSSCVMTGNQWQVAILVDDDMNYVAFSERESTETETGFWLAREANTTVTSHA